MIEPNHIENDWEQNQTDSLQNPPSKEVIIKNDYSNNQKIENLIAPFKFTQENPEKPEHMLIY